MVQFPNVLISRFEPWKDKTGIWKPGVHAHKDNLYEQLHKFKNGFYAQLIDELRKLTDKKKRDAFKQEKLDAFTFSVFISGYRKNENIQHHTGILVIDIDNEGLLPYLKQRQITDPGFTIENLRDELCRANDNGYSNVLFAALSASGTGLFLMFLIEPALHLECFNAITWEFENQYGIKVDPSCKDQTRLRFCTNDPDAVLRHFDDVAKYDPPAEFYEWKRIQEERKSNLKKASSTFKSNSEAATSIINTACKMIEGAGVGMRHESVLKASRLLGGYVATGIFSDDYAHEILEAAVQSRSDWEEDSKDRLKAIRDGLDHGKLHPIHLNVIAPDDPQFEYFTQIKEEEQDRLKGFYNAIHEHNRAGIPFASLELDSLCQTYGIDIDRAEAIAKRLYRNNTDEHGFNQMAKPHKLEVFLKKRWEFRRNEITNEVLFRTAKSGNQWKLLRLEDLWITCCKTGFTPPFEDLSRLIQTEMVERYNPFMNYFVTVGKKYDGVSDYISDLASCFDPLNSSLEYFTAMLRKMLVRAVKCALEPQYSNRYVFVFSSGMQNTGKTWFFRWLNPWGMEQYYAENPLTDNKDDRMRMGEVLVYNLEELSSISRKDVNSLKAIISAGTSRERRPYERMAEAIIRRCSFFGSTNRGDFLTDDLNTRWLIFEINKIDWRYSSEIDRDGLWGQVYDLYKRGYDSELTYEESAVRDAMNERFQEVTSEAELLHRYFEPVEPGHPRAVLLTATDLVLKLMQLSNNPKLAPTIPNISRALKRYKFHATTYRTVRCWALMPIGGQDTLAYPDVRNYFADNIPVPEAPPEYTPDKESPF